MATGEYEGHITKIRRPFWSCDGWLSTAADHPSDSLIRTSPTFYELLQRSAADPFGEIAAIADSFE
jgi:hypothetical protein